MFSETMFHNNGNKQMGFRHGFALGLGLVLLLLAGGLGFMAAREGTGTPAESKITTPAAVPVDELSKAFERVATLVKPAVVNINTEQIIHATSGPMDQFERMFGNGPFGFFFDTPRDLKQRSLGSGFIVDSKGYILTNNHVVKNATKIKVKLDDGRSFDATVVGTDPQTDLAVVKINASDLPTLRLANFDQVKVGEWVLAFGSPFDLEQTMTAGIISAKGRNLNTGNYDNFLQTDAAINPGNSGGPLVNLAGEVVGINTMIMSEYGGFQGVGMAIPATMADNVYRQLIHSGKVTRGWLGVNIQEVTPELAKGFGLGSAKGALVSQVEPNSPASKAGLKSGDVILEFNGKEISTYRDLSLAVADTKVGIPAKLKIQRDGKALFEEVTVGERPAEKGEEERASNKAERARLGITVENLDSNSVRQLNLTSDKGALVTDVEAGSPADEGGVRPGDVIREINHKPVNNASDLKSALREIKSGSTVLLSIIRQGQTLYLAFDLS